MGDELKEIVLNAVYCFFKGKEGISRSRVEILRIVRRIQSSDKKPVNIQEVRVAAAELALSGYLKEHCEKDKERREKWSTYSITDKGIIHIEGESKFMKEKSNDTVNIENINISGVHAPIAIGKNITININKAYNELHQHLETLSKVIQDAEIDETLKKDSLAEIITIDTQLSKKEPNKNIIKEAWDVLEKLATIGSLVESIESIRPLIVGLLSPLIS